MRRASTIVATVLIVVMSTVMARGQLSTFITDWNTQVTVSPYSIELFGQTPATGKVTISYGMFQIMWLHGFETLYDPTGIRRHSHPIGNDDVRMMDHGHKLSKYKFDDNYLAIFINPLQYHFWHFIAQGGIGWFFKSFPDVRGAHLNFQFQLTYMLKDWIGISYSHVSSGFTLRDFNPGLDNISIVLNF